MDTIFIDTNSIRNKKTSSFFGEISQFKRIDSLVNIVIPSMVIEEIKRQKKKYLKSQLDQFCDNYFAKKYFIDKNRKDELLSAIDDKIKKLYEGSNDEIRYKEYDMEPDGKLEKMKEFAIKNLAPFEANSDKGFKDSYIYFSVLEYFDKTHDDVFMITNDARLKMSFEETKVMVLSKVEDYFSYRKEYFKEDYFINRLKDHYVDDTLTSDCVKEINLNEDNDWELTITVDGEDNTLLVDFVSKEIISD